MKDKKKKKRGKEERAGERGKKMVLAQERNQSLGNFFSIAENTSPLEIVFLLSYNRNKKQNKKKTEGGKEKHNVSDAIRKKSDQRHLHRRKKSFAFPHQSQFHYKKDKPNKVTKGRGKKTKQKHTQHKLEDTFLFCSLFA